MEEIAKALELKNELDNLRPIDKEKEAIIMQKFRLDWNYHSNHLEGNSLTYGETKALILFGITAQGKPLKDTLEITGHNEAINWVIDLVKGERPLTENFIRELHSLLLKVPYEVDAITPDGKPTKKLIKVGSYKTTANHVKTKTGEIFYFATPEETPAKMFDLLNWCSQKTKEENVNPILVSAEFHYRFIRIHPFDDGNGRTARILMNFILMQFGFPPVIIKTEDKANYFAALQMADAGNIKSFITYIAKNLVHSLEIMIARAKGESIEEEDDLDKEIALLDVKLKHYKEIISIPTKIKKENLAKIIDKFSENLINIYKDRNKAFLKHYKNFNVSFITELYKDSGGGFYIDSIENIKKTILDSHSFTIEIIFKDFIKNSIGDFDFSSRYIVNFYDYEYTISNEFKILKQDYSSYPSNEEIKIIVDSEVKRHKEFIEQKIAEKENK